MNRKTEKLIFALKLKYVFQTVVCDFGKQAFYYSITFHFQKP